MTFDERIDEARDRIEFLLEVLQRPAMLKAIEYSGSKVGFEIVVTLIVTVSRPPKHLGTEAALAIQAALGDLAPHCSILVKTLNVAG